MNTNNIVGYGHLRVNSICKVTIFHKNVTFATIKHCFYFVSRLLIMNLRKRSPMLPVGQYLQNQVGCFGIVTLNWHP